MPKDDSTLLALGLIGLAWLWSRGAAQGGTSAAMPSITNNPQVTVEDGLDEAVASIIGGIERGGVQGRLLVDSPEFALTYVPTPVRVRSCIGRGQCMIP